MTLDEAIPRMVAPGDRRPGKWRQGVMQIHITRACDLACVHCTQGSNFRGPVSFITPAQFEQALLSLEGYFGVVGMFGGNPALHPQFETLCEIMRARVPFEQRGLWCNNPINQSKAAAMRATFNPRHSNLNVHLRPEAADRFRQWWPEAIIVGDKADSGHAPVYINHDDIGLSESESWEKIAACDINRHWSAMISVFRGELRAWFCELAGAISIRKQDDPDWPDTGLPVEPGWWRKSLVAFREQLAQHCRQCGIPLKGQQRDACGGSPELVSPSWLPQTRPKGDRAVETITSPQQIAMQSTRNVVDYLPHTRRRSA